MARKRDLEAGANPPDVLPVNLDGIPAELRGCAQWVLWKYEARTDQRGRRKWTKVPIRSMTRTPASSTDPATWAKFGDVVLIYTHRKGEYPGIGFNFHHEDPFCGVDLDDCRDPKSGAIAAWAQAIIDRIGSYAEASPSGTGVKIILMGHVPGGRRRVPHEGGEVECYDCGRYFAITGVRVEGTPPCVVEAQEALDEVYTRVFAAADAEAPPVVPLTPPPVPLDLSDAQLLDRMFMSTAGDALRRLWYGETDAYEGDHSRADLALCSHLAWWCQGDATRVDRLFRQSGLIRPKWDERHGALTYGERTISRAMRTLNGTGYNPAAYLASRTPAAASTATPAVPAAPVPAAAMEVNATNQTTPTPTPTPPPTTPAPAPAYLPPPAPHVLRNYRMVPVPGNTGHQQVMQPRGLSAPEIAGPLLAATGNWPRRVGDQLFVPHAVRGIHYLASANALFAWASGQLARGAFGNPIDWAARGADLLTKGEFYDHLAANAFAYEGIQLLPHEPARPEFYYADATLAGGDGSALERYLSFFSPASDVDRDLFLALLMTCAWGGSLGQRPAFVFVANQDDARRGRGVGKSTAAQEVARLFGGFIKVRPSDDFTEVQKRLLSPGAAARRMCLVDNVKSLRLSWDDLEDIITSEWISGRQMYEGEGRRPNVLIWLMTYNGVQLSSDLADRAVIIELSRPRYRGDWKGDLDRFVAANLGAILGDLIARLRLPPGPPPAEPSRWSEWEQSVLSKVGNPAACYQAMRVRQGEANDDSETMELVREAFATALRRNGYDPDRAVLFFTSAQAVTIMGRVEVRYRGVTVGVPYLRQLGVPELRKKDLSNKRGFLWVGQDATYESGNRIQRFEVTNSADESLESEGDRDIPGDDTIGP